MIILLKNMSKSFLKVYINNEYEVNMSPYEEKNIDLNLSGIEINISLSPNKNSVIKNDLYHIILSVSYLCSNIENKAEFIITREKIRFAYNAFYERFFMKSSNAICILKEIKPLDEENLKSQFAKHKKRKFFLSEPFEDFLALPLLLIIIGIVLLFSFGWKITLVYSIFAYISLVIINVVIKKIMKNIFRKHFSFDEQKIFHEYLQQDYISKYYASESREPFLGKKKWLETE